MLQREENLKISSCVLQCIPKHTCSKIYPRHIRQIGQHCLTQHKHSLLHFTVAYHSIVKWIFILNFASLSYFWSILCRWIWKWGRSESGDQRETGTRDFMKLDGGGRFTIIGWRGGTKIVAGGIFPWYPLDICLISTWGSVLHLTPPSLCLISRG